MWKYVLTHELRRPLLALFAASVLATGLLVTRIFLTQRFTHLFLVWNVILAWIPVFLAMRADELEKQGGTRTWSFRATAVAWLLFFPNAPYIFTDLKHLKPILHSRWWTDLIVILLFAFIGIVLAFISLHRMQSVVARRRGWFGGWLFVFGVGLLSGFGVYIGRFERWNSWDVVVRPFALMADSVNWLHVSSMKFTILFAIFLLTSYALLYSLTTLSPQPRDHERTL